MKMAILDCFSGAAVICLLARSLDAGLPLAMLRAGRRANPDRNFELRAEPVTQIMASRARGQLVEMERRGATRDTRDADMRDSARVLRATRHGCARRALAISAARRR